MENISPSVPTSPVAPSSSRKMILIGLGVLVVLGVGGYFLFSGSGTGLKGSFTGDTPTPITGEATAKPITGEATPATPMTTTVTPVTPPAIAPISGEAAPAPLTGEATPAAIKPQPVSVNTIVSDAPVKAGQSTILTIKGVNLAPMIIASSGTALSFSGTNIILTISAGANASFSDLALSPDGSSANVKVTVGDMAVHGTYSMNYFDIGVSDKALGTMQNVLTVL
ncbi:MAG: hypothetical protein NTX63_03365 [Candidatus Peregrinibacteria bacterium]|nr:hypothetical protein [Candidatus Peregrinibacteria bacterium]